MYLEKSMSVPVKFTFYSNMVATSRRVIEVLPNTANYLGTNVKGACWQMIEWHVVKPLEKYVHGP
jgi:hypothetical protein